MTQRMNVQAVILVVVIFVPSPHAWAADDSSIQEVLARIKAMEAKIAAQDAEIGELKGQLKQIDSSAAQKVSAESQVDKTLAKAPEYAVVHDPKLHPRPLTIGGYLDVSYQYNLNKPNSLTTLPPPFGQNNTLLVDRSNHLRVFDTDSNGFDVHLAEIYVDGTAQEKGQAGFRIDLGFGLDTNVFSAVDNNPPDPTRRYDIVQAYADYIAPLGNGVRVKLGKFTSPCGYEEIQAKDNWNASRSYIFGFGTPITHTGAGAEYAINDKWNVKAYIVNGWDNIQDQNDAKTCMFQFGYTPNKWVTWTGTMMAGDKKPRSTDTPPAGVIARIGTVPFQAGGSASNPRMLANTNVVFTPWSKWSFALDSIYGFEGNAVVEGLPGTPRKQNAVWYAAAGYVKYDFMKDYYLALRGEYFADRDGARTAAVLGGGPQRLTSLTTTLSRAFGPAAEIRFEYRHDQSTAEPFGGTLSINPRTSNYFDRDSQDTLMLQWLYKF